MELLSVNSKHTGLCNNQINLDDYLNLVFEEARHIAVNHPSVDYSELISTGYLALGEAKTRFKPEKRAKFSTYATKYLRGKMLDDCRYLEQTVRFPKGCADEVTFSSFESSDYEPFSMEAYYEAEEQDWYAEAVVRVRKAKEQLPSIQRFVIDCRTGKETKTYSEIGRMLNCSPQNVQQEFKRAIRALRASVEFVAFAA